MFRRISGSSSMTNIFFMIPSKNGQSECDGRALADLAVQLQPPTVQIGTALHQQQSEPSAGPRSHIVAAMKGFEQMLLVYFRNTDALVANGADSLPPVRFHCEMHCCSRFRIFRRIAQEI